MGSSLKDSAQLLQTMQFTEEPEELSGQDRDT